MMQHSISGSKLIGLFGLVLLLPVLAIAQSAQGRVTGSVTDPDGAVIPAAEVVAANDDTGITVRTQTNEVGVYVFPFLQPGRYTITGRLDGFKTYVRPGIVVETSQVMELNFAMELGTMTETVTVTSESPLLQTSDSTLGQFVDERTVQNMPLANRRASELVKLSSDTAFVSYDNAGKPQFSVGGGRSFRSTYLLDGGNVQNIRIASLQVDLDPPAEVVQEFRMVQNGYAAEYGGSASGVLISTTKSGTNRFHGSLFEYFRNDRLDAAGFFAPTEGNKKVKAPLRYNLFGGTFGGPIIKNKTHFFAGYEGKRQPLGSTQY